MSTADPVLLQERLDETTRYANEMQSKTVHQQNELDALKIKYDSLEKDYLNLIETLSNAGIDMQLISRNFKNAHLNRK